MPDNAESVAAKYAETSEADVRCNYCAKFIYVDPDGAWRHYWGKDVKCVSTLGFMGTYAHPPIPLCDVVLSQTDHWVAGVVAGHSMVWCRQPLPCLNHPSEFDGDVQLIDGEADAG